LRLAGIYGPARHRLLDQVRAGEAKIPGVAEHRLNLIHRDDVVSAILTAFAAPAELQNQVFNVADGAPAQKANVVEWLAHALGCAVPAFDGQTASARRLQLLDRKISNEKIKAVLGWWPTHGDFRAGYSAILEA
jgi:nucleoside-diphosphate-sugar epimerase